MVPFRIGPFSTGMKYAAFFLLIAANMWFWIEFNSSHPDELPASSISDDQEHLSQD